MVGSRALPRPWQGLQGQQMWLPGLESAQGVGWLQVSYSSCSECEKPRLAEPACAHVSTLSMACKAACQSFWCSACTEGSQPGQGAIAAMRSGSFSHPSLPCPPACPVPPRSRAWAQLP